MIWWSLLIDEIQCLCEWLGEGEIEIETDKDRGYFLLLTCEDFT